MRVQTLGHVAYLHTARTFESQPPELLQLASSSTVTATTTNIVTVQRPTRIQMKKKSFIKFWPGTKSDGESARRTAWNTLRTAMDIANEAVDGLPIPGLKAAIGGLLAVINKIEVGGIFVYDPK